ncbi:hypothetical protein EJ05DRAFT_466030 [Pseudovirgaria hyperparasitica]|uniref:40S ribosomal protein S25 n=1 Tax=Pseudovirgaria hyperparasitica TaxID=470096 RepID=A0A6A6W2K8_9PEZI|nr:uncharacterized protein EJ05DRAFT_466030 [Pseudovirgaria hyperparasitica]KAF2756813.1 hypothetical protein EJ05DRAFT_466030 [Pseudovirgaria hyperparasitica]
MAPAATGGKKQKKKWSKGKVKDKAQHAVVLDKQTQEKLQKDVQSYRLITVATLVDRLKINGSLARKALTDLEEQGLIKKVVGHSKLSVYSMCPSYRSYKVYISTIPDHRANKDIARAVGATE